MVRHFYETQRGAIYLGDSVAALKQLVADESVDLIMTSPPFGLVRKKEYGNQDADDYVEWFRPFGEQFQRVLTASDPGLIYLPEECAFRLNKEQAERLHSLNVGEVRADVGKEPSPARQTAMACRALHSEGESVPERAGAGGFGPEA